MIVLIVLEGKKIESFCLVSDVNRVLNFPRFSPLCFKRGEKREKLQNPVNIAVVLIFLSVYVWDYICANNTDLDQIQPHFRKNKSHEIQKKYILDFHGNLPRCFDSVGSKSFYIISS